MATDDTASVWYAAYGSNLLSARLATYLEGGRARGAARGHRGARDPSPPQAVVPHALSHELYFAGTSRLFGGGIAFVDPDSPGSTHARLYLLAMDQFEDLFAQENGQPSASIDVLAVAAAGTVPVAPGRYGVVVHCGALDGHPILTFTGHTTQRAEANTPTQAYLSLIAAGLAEAHPLDDGQIIDYLLSVPTVRLGWSTTALGQLVREAREMRI